MKLPHVDYVKTITNGIANILQMFMQLVIVGKCEFLLVDLLWSNLQFFLSSENSLINKYL